MLLFFSQTVKAVSTFNHNFHLCCYDHLRQVCCKFCDNLIIQYRSAITYGNNPLFSSATAQLCTTIGINYGAIVFLRLWCIGKTHVSQGKNWNWKHYGGVSLDAPLFLFPWQPCLFPMSLGRRKTISKRKYKNVVKDFLKGEGNPSPLSFIIWASRGDCPESVI